MFTLEQLRAEVIRLATEHPDAVYYPPNFNPECSRVQQVCYYLSGQCNGSIGCIMGQAILNLDPKKREFLHACDTDPKGIPKSISWILRELNLTATMREEDWFTKVQSWQDHGKTWKEAVENANSVNPY